jgi:predicted RNase H-like HicB family nuclease
MKYPIAIEPGTDGTAFGVVFPDLPGCFSAGDTFDEAIENAKEAAEAHIEAMIDDGESIPKPSSLAEVAKNEEFKGWIIGFVQVDLDQLSDKTERINISLPRRVLMKLDQKAKRAGISRSGYIAEAVLTR